MEPESIKLQRPSVSRLAVDSVPQFPSSPVPQFNWARGRLGDWGAKRGSILIIALWSLCMLASFAVILGYSVRQKLSLVERLDGRGKLRLVAEAGIKKAIIQIKKEAAKSYDALKDTWSINLEAFKDVQVGDGIFNVSYGYIDDLSGEAGVQYGIIDEERKININKADLSVLKHFFQIILGLSEVEAEGLAASIVDWRDKDNQPSVPLGSAEDFYYRGLKYPYEAKDDDFEILEELLLVRGVDETVFENIKDYVTIYGDGKININTASKAVLLALGLNGGIVDKIIAFRQGEDRLRATADDNFFQDPSEIVSKLNQKYYLSEAEIAQLTAIVEQYITTSANNFMIKSIANLNNRKDAYRVTCVVNRYGGVLYWRES